MYSGYLRIMEKLHWHTEQRKVSELIPYEKNPRFLSPSQKVSLIESLQKFSLVEIPAIDIDGILIAGHQRVSIFHKKTARVLTNLWVINPEGSQLENHKACYPVELPTKGIELTTVQGNGVFDPFLGTGTTLIAAEQTDRACYGVELDPLYVQLIIERWHNYHQQQQKPTPFKHMNGELNLQELCKK